MGANLPTGPVHSAHGNDFIAVKGDVNEWLLNVWIFPILPLKVAPIRLLISAPQVFL